MLIVPLRTSSYSQIPTALRTLQARWADQCTASIARSGRPCCRIPCKWFVLAFIPMGVISIPAVAVPLRERENGCSKVACLVLGWQWKRQIPDTYFNMADIDAMRLLTIYISSYSSNLDIFSLESSHFMDLICVNGCSWDWYKHNVLFLKWQQLELNGLE